MKTITLKRISMLNFKGIRNLSLDFENQETTICGANGTGKTSVFDAFTWLLFGKDSHDRKDFNIKTFSHDGNAIHKIPHEVSAILEVDGAEVTLRKTFSEKWTKRRGSAEEVFDGHEVECFWNEVPLKASIYNARIADICPEETFKLITNPLYFTAQKTDTQRQLLFRLAGEVTDKEILDDNPGKDFESVLALLNGKTLGDLKREIASKKKIIKESIESIPARIDERRRNINEPKDWNEIAVRIASLKNDVANVNNSILERTKAYDAATAEKQQISRQISDIRVKISQRNSELRSNLLADYYTAKSEFEKTVSEVNGLECQKQDKAALKQMLSTELGHLTNERTALLLEYKIIKDETFVLDESKFVCPTCKRPLDSEDISAKKAEMEANFNTNKVRKLEMNKKAGLENRSRIEELDERIKKIDEELYELDVQIGALKNSEIYINVPKMPSDIDKTIEEDEQIIEWRFKILELNTDFDTEITTPNCEDLLERKNELETAIRNAQVELTERDAIEANNARIAELETEYRKQQEALAELEKIEYNINQFSKARVQAIEGRVNSMFRIVKFKLFDTLVNGNEVDTCEATVDGVPFSTLNQATQLNVGLDIINTICEKEEISAPIIIDNRESVSEILPPTHSQIINLYVNSDYKKLTII